MEIQHRQGVYQGPRGVVFHLLRYAVVDFYAIPAAWGIGQELVSDIGREVSLLFQ